MTPDDFVKYADGMLLLLMFGTLFVIAMGMALESAWHWIEAIVLRCRSWHGRDPDDKNPESH